MKRNLLLLPALASTALISCSMTAGTPQVSAAQTYAVGCIPAINAVAAAVGDMPIPDPDFTGVNYRFANRGSTDLTIVALSRVLPRETWTEWNCTEQDGKATLNVRTSGLTAASANRLHDQFWRALNLPRS